MRNFLSVIGFVWAMVFLGQRFGFLTNTDLVRQYRIANMAADYVMGREDKDSKKDEATPPPSPEEGSALDEADIQEVSATSKKKKKTGDGSDGCIFTDSCDL